MYVSETPQERLNVSETYMTEKTFDTSWNDECRNWPFKERLGREESRQDAAPTVILNGELLLVPDFDDGAFER